MGAVTGIETLTSDMYMQHRNIAYNKHDLMKHAAANWQQIPWSGVEAIMASTMDEPTNVAMDDGEDGALPATAEAATEFEGPAVSPTFSYALGLCQTKDRFMNRGEAAKAKLKVLKSQNAMMSHTKLLNTQIATGDATGNNLSGFPAFVKVIGSYAGKLQTGGSPWGSQAVVDISGGGLADLTPFVLNQALNKIEGRISGDPSFKFYCAYKVKAYIERYGQDRQRYPAMASKFDFGGGKVSFQGFDFVFDHAFDDASDYNIYIVPDSQMWWAYDLNFERTGWTWLTARKGAEGKMWRGGGNMGCRWPWTTCKIKTA